MPLYEYQCQSCGHRFEVIQKFSDAPVSVCPTCGGAVEKLVSSPAIQFKGSGFYLTDYGRGGGSDTAPGKGGKSESGDKAGKSDTADKGGSSDKAAGSSDASTAKPSEGSKSGDSKSSDSKSSDSKPAAPPAAKGG
jgi:putative FmdB family regulatory protein